MIPRAVWPGGLTPQMGGFRRNPQVRLIFCRMPAVPVRSLYMAAPAGTAMPHRLHFALRTEHFALCYGFPLPGGRQVG